MAKTEASAKSEAAAGKPRLPVGISDLIVGDERDQPVPALVVGDPRGAPPPLPAPADALRDLKNLRDSGLISDDDYNRRKADILRRT